MKLVRVVNPKIKRGSKRSATQRRGTAARRSTKNPLGGGELILATINPKKKNGSMRSDLSAKRNSSKRSGRRKSNPSLSSGKRRGSRRRSRNPRGIGPFSFQELGKASVGAFGGSLATPAVTQMVLGAKNTGAIGYLANAGVAVGGGFLVALVMSPIWALGFVAGGLGSTFRRIWSEQVSKTSPAALSGMGDLDFSRNGLGRPGLTGFVNTPYALPSVSARNGQYQIVQQPPWPTAALPPAPTGPATPQQSPASAARSVAAGNAAAVPASPTPQSQTPTGRFASRFAA